MADSIPLYINISYVLILHSPVNGHLGCFHILAIVKSELMDVYVFFNESFVWIYAGPVVVLYLAF